MFIAIVGFIFFACLAMMVREGLWSNTITMVNVFISGTVAFGFYAPLTIKVDEALAGEYTYLLDFLMLWALYVVTMIIARMLTDRLSTTRLRLKHPIDSICGPLMAALAAWVITSFAVATLHTAPLQKESVGGKLVHEQIEGKSALTSPDLAWLRFVERITKSDAYGGKGFEPFQGGPFAKIYTDHRTKLEKASGLRVRR